jgi:hypothetical protein
VAEAALRRALAIKRARRSLPDFERLALGLEPAPHHLIWLNALEAVAAGEIKKLLFIAPPGHGKSSIVSMVWPAWYIATHPNASIIGVTTTDRLGQLYGDAVRTVIADAPGFRSVFPEVLPDRERGWSTERFFVKGPIPRPFGQKDASLVYTGAGGSVIGRRADGVIVDDPIDEEVARSETQLEARKTWIQRTLLSRLKPGGWIVIAGTLWTEGDVVDSSMRTGEFVVIHMQAKSDTPNVVANVWIPNSCAWRP